MQAGHCVWLAADRQSLGQKIGQLLAAMHDGALIHGDLTTSNMLVRADSQELVIHPSWHALFLLLSMDALKIEQDHGAGVPGQGFLTGPLYGHALSPLRSSC